MTLGVAASDLTLARHENKGIEGRTADETTGEPFHIQQAVAAHRGSVARTLDPRRTAGCVSQFNGWQAPVISHMAARYSSQPCGKLPMLTSCIGAPLARAQRFIPLHVKENPRKMYEYGILPVHGGAWDIFGGFLADDRKERGRRENHRE